MERRGDPFGRRDLTHRPIEATRHGPVMYSSRETLRPLPGNELAIPEDQHEPSPVWETVRKASSTLSTRGGAMTERRIPQSRSRRGNLYLTQTKRFADGCVGIDASLRRRSHDGARGH